MDVSTVRDLFLAIFSEAELTALGLETSSFQRKTAIRPLPFVLGLLAACCGGDARTIASAHQQFEALSGVKVVRSSFDERVRSPRAAALLWRLFAKLLLHGNRHERRGWPRELQQFYDILIDDGTQIPLPKSMAERLRSTTPGQAALKLLAHLSLKQGHLDDVRLGAAIHHDSRLLRGTYVKDALYLRDLGFYDHQEFAAIEQAEALFVSAAKSGVVAIIDKVIEGYEAPEQMKGRIVGHWLPSGNVVDVDARLSLGGSKSALFRVVGVRIELTDRHDKPTGKTTWLWFVTNLSRERASAHEIAALYRLRYVCIERLFRRAKSLAKLDQLKSECMPVIMLFVLSSLMVQVLADKLTKQLEDRWGMGQVSPDRIHKTLMTRFEHLCRCLLSPDARASAFWGQLTTQLCHWGAHPNPSQPRRVAQVLDALS